MADGTKSYEFDPTSLVAAASVLIGHKSVLGGTVPSCNPIHGVAEENRDTNIRTFRVIDSLASLCISRTRDQVAAISLQLDFKEGRLLITLAENTDVSDVTVQYIVDLWSQLRELSDGYEQGRVADEIPAHTYLSKSPDIAKARPRENHIYLSKSPDMAKARPGGKAYSIICEVVKLIYEFTLKKFNKKVNKWWGPLRDFTRKFTEIKGRGLHGLAGEFESMMLAFLKGLTALQAETKDWPEVILWMDAAASSAKKVLDCNFRCERWANLVAGGRREPFTLRRAIEKLASHHRYIRTLIRSAHSPRLHQVFLLQMTVDRVPTVPTVSTVTTSLPGSAVEWQSFLRRLCFEEFDKGVGPTKEWPTKEWLEEKAEKLYQQYQGKNFTHRPHAECSLVAFLETTRNTNGKDHCYPPPFSYIGVSKLSCKPCNLWFKVFNSMGGRQYCTRGTHGKWYFPWAAPAMPHWSASGTSALADEMRSVYIKHINVLGSSSSSDSTAASDESTESDKVMREITQKIKNMEIQSIDW